MAAISCILERFSQVSKNKILNERNCLVQKSEVDRKDLMKLFIEYDWSLKACKFVMIFKSDIICIDRWMKR